jgi:hypothetical protein
VIEAGERIHIRMKRTEGVFRECEFFEIPKPTSGFEDDFVGLGDSILIEHGGAVQRFEVSEIEATSVTLDANLPWIQIDARACTIMVLEFEIPANADVPNCTLALADVTRIGLPPPEFNSEVREKIVQVASIHGDGFITSEGETIRFEDIAGVSKTLGETKWEVIAVPVYTI